ncbi:MAG TPA: hypothetical protein VFT64_03820 [Rickettsiales bacterium]|nr:hypothetical protein [Rickettsiales bacterium]
MNPTWLTGWPRRLRKIATSSLRHGRAEIVRILDLTGLVIAIYFTLHMLGFLLLHIGSGIHSRGFSGEGNWLVHHPLHVVIMLWDEFIHTCERLPRWLLQH